MGARALEKNILTVIERKNRLGYVERIWFSGAGPIPKGWKRSKRSRP